MVSIIYEIAHVAGNAFYLVQEFRHFFFSFFFYHNVIYEGMLVDAPLQFHTDPWYSNLYRFSLHARTRYSFIDRRFAVVSPQNATILPMIEKR